MVVAWVKVVESQILGWNLRDETGKARIGVLGPRLSGRERCDVLAGE